MPGRSSALFRAGQHAAEALLSSPARGPAAGLVRCGGPLSTPAWQLQQQRSLWHAFRWVLLQGTGLEKLQIEQWCHFTFARCEQKKAGHTSEHAQRTPLFPLHTACTPAQLSNCDHPSMS